MKFRYCLLLLMFVSHFKSIANEKVQLTYNISSGQIFHYSIESRGTSYLSASRLYTKTIYDVHFVVKAVQKEVINMQLIFDRIRYNNSNDSFDTQSGLPNFGALQPYFGYLIGKPIDFQLTRTGQISSIEGINALVDSIASKYYRKSFREKLQIRQYINEELFSSIITSVFLQYSIKNIDRWEVSNVKKIKIPITYSRKDASKNLTIIECFFDQTFSEKNSLKDDKTKIRTIKCIQTYKIYPLSGLTLEGWINDKIEYTTNGNTINLIDSIILTIKLQKRLKIEDKVTIYGKIRNLDSTIHLFSSNTPDIDFETLKIDSFSNNDGSFSFTRKTNAPFEFNFGTNNNKRFTIFLQPGDSLCINVDFNNWEKSIEFTGKGSFANNLFKDIHNNFLWKKKINLNPIDFKNATLDEYKNKLNKLNLVHDSLTNWAYKHLKANLYSNYLSSLEFYYFKHQKSDVIKMKTEVFSLLFNDANYSDCSISSHNIRRFIRQNIYNQISLTKHSREPESIQNQTAYYFAKLLLPNCEARYYAMANFVYSSIQSPNIKDALPIFEDFKRTYPESEFANNLQSMIDQRADLSDGSIAPNFSLPDIYGNIVSLNSFRGKWVLLFFQNENNEEFEYKKIVVEQIKDKISPDQFEIIWVLLSNNKKIITHQNDYCRQHGTVLLNPEWKIAETKKYKNDFKIPSCLITPDGKVEIGEYFNVGKDFIHQLIETINNDTNKKESSFISKKALLWAFGIIVIIFGLVIFIYKRRLTLLHKRETKLREKLDLELKAIRSQLNPHFMFNSLSSIQHLVNENRVDDANRYLSSFAGLMRKVLHQSEKELIPLENELDTLRQYLELEALRFKFNFDIEIDSNIDIFNVEIPPLVLQPFVENAVIHGIAGMHEKGHIHIGVNKNSKQITIVIDDNGLGINNSAINHKLLSNGKGLELTHKRMDIIRKNFSNEMTFTIRDKKSENQQGTRVEIKFDIEK
jgi:hypothetical protein